MAQPGSALALGARCRRFKSCRPDQFNSQLPNANSRQRHLTIGEGDARQVRYFADRVPRGRRADACRGAGPFEWTLFDEEDARAAGTIRAELEALGRPIGAYDVLLAGQARRHGATLVTSNAKEFARVSGLKWEDWAASRR